MIFLWISLVFVVNSVIAVVLDNSTLKFVQILFRHGDSTPSYTLYLPSDQENTRVPWSNSRTEALGELTKEGINQLYNTGKYLHDRYGFLVNFTYDASQLFVESGEENRTITSALALLAGMFPPNSNQIWNSQLKWQPIPVHIAKYIDEAATIISLCPNFGQLLRESPSFQDFLKSHKSVIDFLLLKSRICEENVDPLFGLIIVLGNLKVRESHKKTHPLPKWVDEIPRNISFEKFLADVIWNIFNEPNIQSWIAGTSLAQYVAQMTQYIHRANGHKMHFYSAHKSNMMVVAKVLQVKNFSTEGFPIDGAYLSIELHEIKQKFYVQIWYRDTLNEEQKLLSMNSCPEPCGFDNFEKLTHLLTIDQWNNKCKGESKQEREIRSWRIVTVILAITCFVLFGLLFFCWLYQRINHRMEEEPLLIN